MNKSFLGKRERVIYNRKCILNIFLEDNEVLDTVTIFA